MVERPHSWLRKLSKRGSYYNSIQDISSDWLNLELFLKNIQRNDETTFPLFPERVMISLSLNISMVSALSLLVLDIWIQNNRIYSSALYNTSLTSLIELQTDIGPFYLSLCVRRAKRFNGQAGPLFVAEWKSVSQPDIIQTPGHTHKRVFFFFLLLLLLLLDTGSWMASKKLFCVLDGQTWLSA